MEKRKITIEVPADIAQAYESASASERQSARRAVSYALMPRHQAAKELRQLLDRTGKMAQERGLTEKKLQDLLDED